MRTGVFSLILFVTFACTSKQRVITVEAKGLNTDKLYLCEVISEYRGIHQAVDSAVLKDGKFVFNLQEEIPPELYFIGDSPWHGGYVFLDGNDIKLTLEDVTEEQMCWEVKGSPLNEVYRRFEKVLYDETFGQIKDSLNALFYEARERQDQEEMARIKNESMPYYDEGVKRERMFVDSYIQENKANPLGIYLYYSRVFQRKDFPTEEEIAAEREYIQSFGEMAKVSSSFMKMEQQLSRYENCAIGHEAPEIVGKDTLGNELKLSDLRGNYVLVDFWNSYCHWCREETPALKRALEHFAGKNFKILGVSFDRVKKLWMDAIHEDGSYWDHLMLEKGDDVMERYCIKGIPHIILVGPDGKILAKELRGQELIDVLDQFVK